MKIIVASLFRDSIYIKDRKIDHVNRFFNQLNNQSIDVDFFVEEGNSKDETYEQLIKLQQTNKNVKVLKYDVSTKSKVESRNTSDRLNRMSLVGNKLLDHILKTCSYFDYLLWCESDIIINDSSLIWKLAHGFSLFDDAGIIAPLVLCSGAYNGKNYDIFCFRHLNGKQWTQNYVPSKSDLIKNKYLKVSSVGSVVMIKYDVLTRCKFGRECFATLCKCAIKNKYDIYVDTSLKVYHPTNKNIDGRWI